jgi:hypothetical protein
MGSATMYTDDPDRGRIRLVQFADSPSTYNWCTTEQRVALIRRMMSMQATDTLVRYAAGNGNLEAQRLVREWDEPHQFD